MVGGALHFTLDSAQLQVDESQLLFTVKENIAQFGGGYMVRLREGSCQMSLCTTWRLNSPLNPDTWLSAGKEAKGPHGELLLRPSEKNLTGFPEDGGEGKFESMSHSPLTSELFPLEKSTLKTLPTDFHLNPMSALVTSRK